MRFQRAVIAVIVYLGLLYFFYLSWIWLRYSRIFAVSPLLLNVSNAYLDVDKYLNPTVASHVDNKQNPAIDSPAPMTPSSPADGQPLVDFLIIGAMKCGTTYLYNLLTQHPNISATTKELSFFNDPDNLIDDVGAKRELYRQQLRRRPGALAGEATPLYLQSPIVPAAVKAAAPNVKLIALLRNPTDRAWSHHKRSLLQSKTEDLPFLEALMLDPVVRHDAAAARSRYLSSTFFRQQQLALLNNYSINTTAVEARRMLGVRTSYLSLGLYLEQLQRWYEVFPRSQLLVLRSDDLFRAPLQVLVRITEFLNIAWYNGFMVDRAFRFKGLDIPMPDDLRAFVDSLYKNANEALANEVAIRWP